MTSRQLSWVGCPPFPYNGEGHCSCQSCMIHFFAHRSSNPACPTSYRANFWRFDAMPEWNFVSWNALVTVYVQRKRMEEARKLFDAMPMRNISSWNTMVTRYAQAGMLEEARCFLERMSQHHRHQARMLEAARCFSERMPQHHRQQQCRPVGQSDQHLPKPIDRFTETLMLDQNRIRMEASKCNLE